MKIIRTVVVAVLLGFIISPSAWSYSYIPESALTDPVTGLSWDDPGRLAFYGFNTLDFIQTSGVRLATYNELLQLFQDIGNYSPEINHSFGYIFRPDDQIITGGYYDAGAGAFGVAFGHYRYSQYEGVTSYPWSFSPATNFSPDVGLWVITGSTPVPEPSTFLLLGFGLVGIGLLKKKRALSR